MSKYLRSHGKPWIERVLTPSLSIIYPLYSEYLEKGFFLYFFPFWLDEIKVSGDSCLPRHFANAKCKPAFQNSRFCHRITELATLLGNNKWGIP